MHRLTKYEVECNFKTYVMPVVRAQYERDGIPNYPARSKAWNDYIDSLCKEGSITVRQYENWNAPAICGR